MPARETWATLPGKLNQYDASTEGRIRTEDRILKPAMTDGHYYIVLTDTDGKRTNRSVASLVLRAHVGPPQGNVNRAIHKGDPADDSLRNIKWGTQAEQTTRQHHPGQDAPAVTEEQARKAHAKLTSGRSSLDAEAKRLGVTRKTLTNEIDRLRLPRRTRRTPAA